MNSARVLLALLFVVSVFVFPASATAYEGDGVIESGEPVGDELRKASQNLMADLISFPI
jgi:hypothetical protein